MNDAPTRADLITLLRDAGNRLAIDGSTVESFWRRLFNAADALESAAPDAGEGGEDGRVDPLTAQEIEQAFECREFSDEMRRSEEFEFTQNYGKDAATVREVVIARALGAPSYELKAWCESCDATRLCTVENGDLLCPDRHILSSPARPAAGEGREDSERLDWLFEEMGHEPETFRFRHRFGGDAREFREGIDAVRPRPSATSASERETDR
jgi:hypothetical protein